MTTEKMYPSLSETGWIKSPELIADNLFADFYEADYSQTQLYLGRVSSFAYLIAQYQEDIPALLSNIQKTLGDLYGRYFNTVQVEVRDESPANEPSKVTISIFIAFKSDDGTQYNLARSIRDAGTKTAKVFKLNNGT